MYWNTLVCTNCFIFFNMWAHYAKDFWSLVMWNFWNSKESLPHFLWCFTKTLLCYSVFHSIQCYPKIYAKRITPVELVSVMIMLIWRRMQIAFMWLTILAFVAQFCLHPLANQQYYQITAETRISQRLISSLIIMAHHLLSQWLQFVVFHLAANTAGLDGLVPA